MTPAPTQPHGAGLCGRTLGGRYHLEARIARGGAADVYVGHDRRLGRRVAVKVALPPDDCLECQLCDGAGCGLIERVAAEAQVGARIDDPHVVPIHDVGVERREGERPRPFLVMPRIYGRSLRARILDGGIPWRHAVTFGRHLLAGLAAIHEQGFLHGDLKPENCLLCERSGREPYLRIIDLGEARPLRGAPSAAIGRRPDGTPHYAAPEQILGQELSVQADLYAVGAILYEALCRRPPFVGTDEQVLRGHLDAAPRRPNEVHPDAAIPWRLEALVLAALSKDPRQRPASAAAFERALENACPDPHEDFAGELGRSDRITLGGTTRLGSAGFAGLNCSPTHAGAAQAQASLAAWTRFEYGRARYEAATASALNGAWSPLQMLMSLAPEE
jgi:serine/threonine protein kinase